MNWSFCPIGMAPVKWVCGLVLFMAIILVMGCSKSEPYEPPDLLYLFATYKVGINPTSINAGDFNHDGVTDLVTTNIGNSTLSLLFGNGDGTFKDQISIPACKEPRALVKNDLNGDTLLDLAITCSGSDQVQIFFGHPSGAFGLGPSYSLRRAPVSIAAGDVNGDSFMDLLVALRNDKIQVLLGSGGGSFRKGPQYQYGDTPTSIAAIDFNGDDLLDLAVTNGGPMSSAVSIWLGKGDGTFQKPTDYRTGKRPLLVKFADFNNDKEIDLLVVNGERDTFTVFLGNGDGTFQKGKEAGANAGPVSGLAQDFNGDQLTDVAITNIQSNDVSILYGKGDGTFRYPPKNYLAKRGPFAVTTLYLNSKETEVPGLAVANNGEGSVSVFLHRGLRGTSGTQSKPSFQ